MLQTKLNNRDVVLVTVPKGADRFSIKEGLLIGTLLMHDKYLQLDNGVQILLPVGEEDWYEWQCHGIVAKVGEEIATGLVDVHTCNQTDPPHSGYKDYMVAKPNSMEDWYDVHDFPFNSAIASLASFSRSHSLDPETTVLLTREE